MNRMILLATMALLGVGPLCAALTEADLTPNAISNAMLTKPEAERQAFAREVIGAVAAQPIDDAAKTESLVTASRALISGAEAQKVNVIAEVFNSVPVAQLQGVADLLSDNFGEKVTANEVKGLTSEQYDKLASGIVKSVSQYIEASGTDSPTVRMGILAATFTKASSDPNRTRPVVIAALPASVQAAASTYLKASEEGNREMIAAAAGVDEVAPTPAVDPDAASVVVPAEETPAPAAAEAAETIASERTKPAADEAKVPLLSRWAADSLGLTFDAMRAATYDWAAVEDPLAVRTDSMVPTLPGFANVVGVPGERFPAGQPLPKPSPSYGNQYVR